MKIRWSPEAVDDFEAAVQRILDDNPTAARRMAQIIYDGIGALTAFPNRGRIGRVEGTREFLVSEERINIYAPLRHIGRCARPCRHPIASIIAHGRAWAPIHEHELPQGVYAAKYFRVVTTTSHTTTQGVKKHQGGPYLA